MNANSKSNDKFNPWNYLIQGVPRESIHDPVLFLIHLNFFFWVTDMSGMLPMIKYQNLENALMSLEEDSEMTICWFENNYMKINTDECHLLALGLNITTWTFGHEKI